MEIVYLCQSGGRNRGSEGVGILFLRGRGGGGAGRDKERTGRGGAERTIYGNQQEAH